MTRKNNSQKGELTEELEASLPEVQEPQEELVDFDSWYATIENKIESCHRKEILAADFKARKVPSTATVNQFNEALRKYGIKLD